jgi:hypothetical protein
MAVESRGLAGRRVVVGLYLAIVVVAGVMGFILGTISPAALEPVLFGVIALPPTPAGVALYGIVTVGVLLGGLLVGVRAVSARYPDA